MEHEYHDLQDGNGEIIHLTELDIRKRAMIEALEKNLGIIAQACRVVGISRQTHYDWMRDDLLYNKQVKMISETAIDFVEGKLLELVNGVRVQDSKNPQIVYVQPPNVAACIFYLKTNAKKRGYIERYDIMLDNEDRDVETSLEF
jgi:hypothetical protein